ncbi:precorrin-3B synthase [Angustibacter luteus]|uniref:Precorrin-3B synthase n=1 Tax=Angustibacter luteus TaxID=658456 RepID=A0ABW1JB96_9ACTN
MGPAARGRTAADACPGALRPHLAADGAMVRLRMIGGVLASRSLAALADLADRHGDGALHLTSRGNVQLRALRAVGQGLDPVVVQAIQGAGLLSSPSHELVRNVLVSPGTGRLGGLVDLTGAARELDRQLCQDRLLPALPGRFLFALDDGTGDVVGLGADVGWWALPSSGDDPGAVPVGALVVSGRDTGVRLTLPRAVPALLAVARAFVARRAQDARVGGAAAWRIGELPDGVERATSLVLQAEPSTTTAAPVALPPARTRLPELGVLVQHDGRSALAVLVPLGRLSTAAARVMARSAEGVVLTPWREVLVPDLTASAARNLVRELSGLGLDVTGTSGWRGVSACAGRPGCARALVDVRALAYRSVGLRVAASDATGEPSPLHYSGCERRCGHPAGPHDEVVATTRGLIEGRVDPTAADPRRSTE